MLPSCHSSVVNVLSARKVMLSHPRRFVKTQFCISLGLFFFSSRTICNRVTDYFVCRPDKIIVYHNLRRLSRANFGIKRPPVLRPRPASRRFLLDPASSGVAYQFLVIRRELLSAPDFVILARTLDAVKSRNDADSNCHNVTNTPSLRMVSPPAHSIPPLSLSPWPHPSASHAGL